MVCSYWIKYERFIDDCNSGSLNVKREYLIKSKKATSYFFKKDDVAFLKKEYLINQTDF